RGGANHGLGDGGAGRPQGAPAVQWVIGNPREGGQVMVRTATIRRGSSCPLGATLSPEGVNFSVFSKSAILVELLLFDDVQAAQPARVVRLDPRWHRTYHYWHVFVPGLQAGQLYGYRVSGPWAPPRGLRGAPG